MQSVNKVNRNVLLLAIKIICGMNIAIIAAICLLISSAIAFYTVAGVVPKGSLTTMYGQMSETDHSKSLIVVTFFILFNLFNLPSNESINFRNTLKESSIIILSTGILLMLFIKINNAIFW